MEGENSHYNSEETYRFYETMRPTNEQKHFALEVAKEHLKGDQLIATRFWIYFKSRTVAHLRELLKRWDRELPGDRMKRKD
jgi:hypothetical protein